MSGAHLSIFTSRMERTLLMTCGAQARPTIRSTAKETTYGSANAPVAVPWHDKFRVDRCHHFIDVRESAGFEDDERGHDTDPAESRIRLDYAGPCNCVQAADRCVNGNDQRGDDEREPERDLENGDKDDCNRRILPDKVDERDNDTGNRGRACGALPGSRTGGPGSPVRSCNRKSLQSYGVLTPKKMIQNPMESGTARSAPRSWASRV